MVKPRKVIKNVGQLVKKIRLSRTKQPKKEMSK